MGSSRKRIDQGLRYGVGSRGLVKKEDGPRIGVGAGSRGLVKEEDESRVSAGSGFTLARRGRRLTKDWGRRSAHVGSSRKRMDQGLA